MEILSHLALGFETALSLTNLFYCLVGVALGTAIGVLPGLGPVPTIAMLLPRHLWPAAGHLADHAVRHLLRRAVRRLDHRHPRQPAGRSPPRSSPRSTDTRWRGKAGPARRSRPPRSARSSRAPSRPACSSRFPPPLANVALRFGPPEYFSLMLLGLVASIVLAHGGLLHAVGMVVLGLLLGTVGTDLNSGMTRYTFGIAAALRRHQLHRARGRHLRHRRDRGEPPARDQPRGERQEDHRPDALARGSAPHRRADPARHRHRLGPRHPAGRRRDAGGVRGLRGGEEDLAPPAGIRQGRHRGRRRAGEREQRRRADLVHPDADPRHPVEPGDGADDRRDDHPGHPAGAERDDRAAGPVLGHHRLDVGRQSDAARAQPAAGRLLGADDPGALPLPLPDHPRLQRDRRVIGLELDLRSSS